MKTTDVSVELLPLQGGVVFRKDRLELDPTTLRHDLSLRRLQYLVFLIG